MSNVVIRREPLTYERDNASVSYFRDLFLRDRDPGAERRLARHADEMRVELGEREQRNARGLAREMDGGRLAGAEVRTINRTEGTGGFFAQPLWLIEQFATAPRAPRVLGGLVTCFPAPSNVSSLNLPRLTTGNQALAVADDTAVPGQDIADAAPISAMVTIEGQGVYPKQLLEQSPGGAHLDWAMMKDLGEAYDATLEQQLINGAGTGTYNDTQLQGIINVSGVNKQTYTSATPTFSQSTTATSNMYYYMGQASAQVGDNRKLPPEAWLMTTSRWSWIATSVDNQGRPIVPPDLAAPRHPRGLDGDGDDIASLRPVSSIYGWPVFADDAIPSTLGTTGNWDTIIACRPSDIVMIESDPMTMVTEDDLSGTLGVRVSYRRYVAAVTGRYPSGIAYLAGTGMVVQSGF